MYVGTEHEPTTYRNNALDESLPNYNRQSTQIETPPSQKVSNQKVVISYADHHHRLSQMGNRPSQAEIEAAAKDLKSVGTSLISNSQSSN